MNMILIKQLPSQPTWSISPNSAFLTSSGTGGVRDSSNGCPSTEYITCSLMTEGPRHIQKGEASVWGGPGLLASPGFSAFPSPLFLPQSLFVLIGASKYADEVRSSSLPSSTSSEDEVRRQSGTQARRNSAIFHSFEILYSYTEGSTIHRFSNFILFHSAGGSSGQNHTHNRPVSLSTLPIWTIRPLSDFPAADWSPRIQYV